MVQNRQEFFGYTAAGKPVTRYWLCNDAMQVGIIDLGGSIQSVIVQNRTGQAVDVALGYDNPRAYETQNSLLAHSSVGMATELLAAALRWTVSSICCLQTTGVTICMAAAVFIHSCGKDNWKQTNWFYGLSALPDQTAIQVRSM